MITIKFNILSVGFTKIYKDVGKATQEVEKIIAELDCENLGQIDYTRKFKIVFYFKQGFRIHHCFNESG